MYLFAQYVYNSLTNLYLDFMIMNDVASVTFAC
jgi:hypothetical protein